MPDVPRPYHPIIYVRGYAMTQSEIAATVATPYMGFNLGATKTRQDWQGKTVRHIFESPLVRLMKDHGYRDIYADGSEIQGTLPERSIVIYRYYEQADEDLGSGELPGIVDAAKGLRDLIHTLRDRTCGQDAAARAAFRVYLVAHSMGGLVCRCFLQNDKVSKKADRALVDKVFTYATPHNGIEIAGVNTPRFLGLRDMNNFNRTIMAKYLGLAGKPERVDSLDGKFDPDRFFCLVGTNHKDYDTAFGLSAKLAGEMSDGLVKIENATVRGAPRAFVHRTHSGPYGIVNSEDGYQNLVRFLFGDLRVTGTMEVDELPLPPSVRQAKEQGKPIEASYYFEATVAPRGTAFYKLTERRKETHSAVLRQFDQMLRLDKAGLDKPRWPVLFSAFLDTRNITTGNTVVFTVELTVSTTGYTIDNTLWLDQHVEGEYLYRDTLTLRASLGDDGWTLRYNRTDEAWSESTGHKAEQDAQGMYIPLSSKKGFKGRLRLTTAAWR